MPQITVHRSLGLNPSWVQSAPLMGPACANLDLSRSFCESLFAGRSKSGALVQLSGYSLVTHENESSVAACRRSERAKTAYLYLETKRFMLRRTTMRTMASIMCVFTQRIQPVTFRSVRGLYLAREMGTPWRTPLQYLTNYII